MVKRATKQAQREEELPKPELLISRTEAQKQIMDRIEKGEDLLKVSVQTEADLDKLHEDKKIWSEYNAELLE